MRITSQQFTRLKCCNTILGKHIDLRLILKKVMKNKDSDSNNLQKNNLKTIKTFFELRVSAIAFENISMFIAHLAVTMNGQISTFTNISSHDGLTTAKKSSFSGRIV